jgi:hypothetical protein
MKKIALLFLIALFTSTSSHAQRILLSEDFDSGPYTADSIPIGWAKFKVNGPGGCVTPAADWRVRDSGKVFCLTNTLPGFTSKSHNSLKAVNIPWTATTGSIVDDWLFTDSVSLVTGDSLKFWVQLGTWPDGQSTYYLDSLQIWITSVNTPTGGTRTRIATVTSLPSTSNVWQFKTFDLSTFNGQRVYVGFRYYMNVSLDGIMVNIDEVFVGNLSGPPVGIPTVHSNLPKRFDLKQNYPNPFNPVTSIDFDLPRNEFVRLAVYNSLGQEVAVLVNNIVEAGTHKISFDASNLPSGIYICRISAGNFTMTRKMSLVK